MDIFTAVFLILCSKPDCMPRSRYKGLNSLSIHHHSPDISSTIFIYNLPFAQSTPRLAPTPVLHRPYTSRKSEEPSDQSLALDTLTPHQKYAIRSRSSHLSTPPPSPRATIGSSRGLSTESDLYSVLFALGQNVY